MQRRNIFKFIFVLLLICINISCVSTSKEDPTWYSVNENVLTVDLEGNATTGFSWNYEIEDESIVEFSSSEYLIDQRYLSSLMVGYGGTWEFKFNGIKKGTTIIHFVYKRSWEENSELKRIDLKIKVSESGSITSVSVLEDD